MELMTPTEFTPLLSLLGGVLIGASALMESALTGGDDFEVLAAVPPDQTVSFIEAARSARVPVTDIGALIEPDGAPATSWPTIVLWDNHTLHLPQRAFDHARANRTR